MRTWIYAPGFAILALACGGQAVDASQGAGDDASDSVVGDAGPPVTKNGLLMTSSIQASGGGELGFVNIIASSGAPCSVSRTGSCLVQDCRGLSGGPAMGVSAGEVDLTRSGTKLLRIAPAAGTDLYPEDVTTSAPWSAGESLTFVAAGAQVPAFTIPLTSPPALKLLSPLPDGSTTYRASQDLILGWQKLDGDVSAQLVQTNASHDIASTVRVLCEWQGAPGAGSIPASLVGMLSTDPSLTNTLEVGGSAHLDLALSGYWVHVALMNFQGGAFKLAP